MTYGGADVGEMLTFDEGNLSMEPIGRKGRLPLAQLFVSRPLK